MEAATQQEQAQQQQQQKLAQPPAVMVNTILEEEDDMPGSNISRAGSPPATLSGTAALQAALLLQRGARAAADADGDVEAGAADATATILLGVASADSPAIADETAPQTAAVAVARQQPAPVAVPRAVSRSLGWQLRNYIIIPLCLPVIAAWWLLALLAAAALTFTIVPSLFLARRLYWACPFIPFIWASDDLRSRVGRAGSWLLRLQFEGAHCMTVLARLFSLPLRPHLPDFYILGFPKCGTTSLAAYLRQHPALSGLSGMPGNEIFSKESHFFGGILGRHTTGSAALYRSFFSTLLTRWWSEAVLGVGRWMCFDACPTFACQPHVAVRARALTPGAKLVVMVRDPPAGVFSAETMLRNMGVPLSWTLAQPLVPSGEEALDQRFQFDSSDEEFWRQLAALPVDAPLPRELPERFYFKLHSYLMAGRFADRLAPWVREFGAENLLLVDYAAFVANPEQQVRAVLEFVGADTSLYRFQELPARMKGEYRGARMDAGVAAWLNDTWFADSNAALADMIAAQAGAK